MSSRNIVFKGKIPLSKIDWFAKLLYNICPDDIEYIEVSGEKRDVVLSLRKEHVEAIANEATTYIEMEDNVTKMVDERNK